MPSALLMMLFFFLSMACVGVIKPLSTAICLNKVGFDSPRYPALIACLALLAGPIVLLFQSLAKRLAHSVLLIATVGFFLLTFGVFYFFIFQFQETWVYFTFFAWGGILNLLIPTLGWVISYDLYRIQDAKRLFGLLATGGVLGGAAGSLSAFLGADRHGWLETQVLLCLAVLELTAILLYREIRRRKGRARGVVRSGRKPPTPGLDSLKNLLQLPYVRCMAGLVLLAALSTTLIDLNYQWFFREQFAGRDLTKLLALVLMVLYLVSACVNMFGTQRILKRFGLPVLLLISPAMLGGASLVTALLPLLWPVVAVKALGGILSPSLYRTGVEMLYVPLASRHQTLPLKSFIDLAVFKLGDALGAVLFLVLGAVLVHPVQLAAILQLGAIAAWGFLAFRIGKEYVRHLRHSVQEGIGIQFTSTQAEGRPEEVLIDALQSSDPVKIRLALIGLRQLESREEEPPPQFPYEGETLLQAKMSSMSPSQTRWLHSAASLLNHSNPEIGAAALHLMVRHDPVGQLKLLRAKLKSEWLPEPVYLYYLDRYIEQPGRLLEPTNVLRWCQNLSVEERAGMARVMGKARERAFLPLLRQWTQQEPSGATLASIEAIGRFADPRFVPLLCTFLGSYWSRKAARKALTFYGETVVAHLTKILQEPESDPAIRREIPLILGGIRCSSSRTTLAGALYHPDPVVSYRAVQALNRIRELQDLSYTGDSFLPVVEFWARQYYSLTNLESFQESGGPCGKLLSRALEERKRNLIERIFRTLDLFLPRGDAHYCYRVIVEDRHDLRDHAIELVETQLHPRLKEVLLPLLSDSSRSELAAAGRKLFNLSDTADLVVSEALVETDPWIRCCLLAAIREWKQVSRVLTDSVQRYSTDFNALVRETAQWVLEGIQPSAMRTTGSAHNA